MVDWLTATAPWATVVVALAALVLQKRSNDAALRAQRQAGLEAREHESALAREERLWSQRVELYARILGSVRAYLDRHQGDRHDPGGDRAIAALVAEANILASEAMLDLVNRFAFDEPSEEAVIELEAEMQTQARHELGCGRLPKTAAS